MKTKTLSLEKLRLDGDTQPRAEIDNGLVYEYTEAYKAGVDLPLLVVFYDGVSYWLVDGFHRWHAARKAELAKVRCEVRLGTLEEARWHSYAVNQTHGLRRTNADKRKAVEYALRHPKGAKLSNNKIAEHVGVSDMFVGKVRKDLTTNGLKSDQDEEPREGRDGRTINTANIGKGGAKGDDEPIDVDSQPATPAEVQEAVAQAAADDAKPEDFGKCPNCAGAKWIETDDGTCCKKCNHPHGEPAGDADDDRMNTQRQKTVKTLEAAMRAFDDLQTMKARVNHANAIECCKQLIKIAKEWK